MPSAPRSLRRDRGWPMSLMPYFRATSSASPRLIGLWGVLIPRTYPRARPSPRARARRHARGSPQRVQPLLDLEEGGEHMPTHWGAGKTRVDTIRRYGDLADRDGDAEAAARAWT